MAKLGLNLSTSSPPQNVRGITYTKFSVVLDGIDDYIDLANFDSELSWEDLTNTSAHGCTKMFWYRFPGTIPRPRGFSAPMLDVGWGPTALQGHGIHDIFDKHALTDIEDDVYYIYGKLNIQGKPPAPPFWMNMHRTVCAYNDYQGALSPFGASEDNDAELGPELITDAADREFSSDTGYWTFTGGASITGGVCEFLAADTDDGIHKDGILEVGKSYLVTFDRPSYTSGVVKIIGGTAEYSETDYTGFYPGTDGSGYIPKELPQQLWFIADGTRFAIRTDEDATEMDIDNVSLKEIVGTNATTFGNMTDGNWHHIAFTYYVREGLDVADQGNLALYIDGMRYSHDVGACPDMRPYGQVGDINHKVDHDFMSRLGADINTINPYTHYGKGQYDEVAYWKGSLPADAIEAIYNNGNSIPLATPSADVVKINFFGGHTLGTNNIAVDPIPYDLPRDSYLTFSGGAEYRITTAAKKDDIELLSTYGLTAAVADDEEAPVGYTQGQVADLIAYYKFNNNFNCEISAGNNGSASGTTFSVQTPPISH